jgi:hypothetical protein
MQCMTALSVMSEGGSMTAQFVTCEHSLAVARFD